MDKEKVSIIIPTYNRAHLITETLDSVAAQTYVNWECLIIDDGSTDNTIEVINEYSKKDSRFAIYKRPENYLPGGNGARNFGFKISKGNYIQWFDSDDLMKPDKLRLEVEALQTHKVDFVVSKTKYFNRKNNSFFNYDFEAKDVNFESYAIDYLRWHTPDLMVKKDVAEKIKFNEKMKAGQEYNYNCKLLLHTNNLYYLNIFLTLRRYSEGSIQGRRDQSRLRHLTKMFETHWYNYLDLKELANSSKFNRFSILQCILCYLESKNKIKLPDGFDREVRHAYNKRYYYFYLARYTNMIIGKYHHFYMKLKNNEIFNTYTSRLENQAQRQKVNN